MRTTIDLPDGLFHRVKLAAVQRRLSLKTLITQLVETGLKQAVPAPKRMTQPPLRRNLRKPVAALSSREMAAALEADDATKFRVE